MCAPSGTTTSLSRIALRTTAPRPIRTPSISTEPSTYAPAASRTFGEMTLCRTVAPATIDAGADHRLLRDPALDELRRRQLRVVGEDRPLLVVEVEDRVDGDEVHVRVVVGVDRPDVAPVTAVAVLGAGHVVVGEVVDVGGALARPSSA